VVKPPKTKEELEANIFAVYSKYKEEIYSDRKQVYFGQFCDHVFRWCTNFKIIYDIQEMGVEIVEALGRIVKKEIDEKNFFGYLVRTLNNVKNEYYRKNISSEIKTPRIVKNIEKNIFLRESNAGRMLSEEEKIKFISEWYNKSEEKVREYLIMIENKNTDSLSTYDNEESDIPDLNNDPERTFFSNFSVQENAAIIREAVESVLLIRQDRTRECYRALFTALCIKEALDYLEELASVLDNKLLSAYRDNGAKPEQYEIYKMYHQDATKESAGVRASEMLKTLLNDLKIVLKDKI